MKKFKEYFKGAVHPETREEWKQWWDLHKAYEFGNQDTIPLARVEQLWDISTYAIRTQSSRTSTTVNIISLGNCWFLAQKRLDRPWELFALTKYDYQEYVANSRTSDHRKIIKEKP